MDSTHQIRSAPWRNKAGDDSITNKELRERSALDASGTGPASGSGPRGSGKRSSATPESAAAAIAAVDPRSKFDHDDDHRVHTAIDSKRGLNVGMNKSEPASSSSEKPKVRKLTPKSKRNWTEKPFALPYKKTGTEKK